jgi:hypothetical protein
MRTIATLLIAGVLGCTKPSAVAVTSVTPVSPVPVLTQERFTQLTYQAIEQAWVDGFRACAHAAYTSPEQRNCKAVFGGVLQDDVLDAASVMDEAWTPATWPRMACLVDRMTHELGTGATLLITMSTKVDEWQDWMETALALGSELGKRCPAGAKL